MQFVWASIYNRTTRNAVGDKRRIENTPLSLTWWYNSVTDCVRDQGRRIV